MTNSDDHISLLREIRDNQAKQTEAVVRALKAMEDSQNVYVASRTKYEQERERNQEEYRKSQESYRSGLRRHALILAAFLGIIALCMIVNIVLRLVGK